MRALVTGSAGFIGRHMSAELSARGYVVHGIDLNQHYEDGLFGYLRNWDKDQVYDGYYDLVVHCAYHVGGRAGIDGINTNFAKNLQLDAALFEWAVRTKQKRVLYFSSSAAYPEFLQSKYWAEDPCFGGKVRLGEAEINLGDVLQPDASYGWAKLTGERLAEDARKSGLDVTVVRPFSGYGEDQSLDYPFMSICGRAAQGDLAVWGPPGQTRDWIHVSDVVQGSLAIVDSGTNDPVNLCTGRAVEMGLLAMMAYCQARDAGGPYAKSATPTYDESKPTGVFYRVGDPTRMLKYYEPKVSLEEGIDRALKAGK